MTAQRRLVDPKEDKTVRLIQKESYVSVSIKLKLLAD
jgi:hypothetical protein